MIRQSYSESMQAIGRNMIKFTVMWRVAVMLPGILVLGTCLYMKYDGFSVRTSRSEFDTIVKDFMSQGIGEIYYKGRSGDYDYFEIYLNIYATEKIHLKATESPVSDPFPYTSDKDNWRSGQKTFMTFSYTKSTSHR